MHCNLMQAKSFLVSLFLLVLSVRRGIFTFQPVYYSPTSVLPSTLHLLLFNVEPNMRTENLMKWTALLSIHRFTLKWHVTLI